MKQGSTVYYLFGDHLGSTAITASSAGAKLGELRYKPWGESRYTWGTTYTNRHFTGQLDETSSIGLYFFNARFYDPLLGRFTSADSLIPNPGNPQVWDRYAYGLNNPVKYIDPTGHRTCTEKEAASGDETCDENITPSLHRIIHRIRMGSFYASKPSYDKDDLPSNNPLHIINRLERIIQGIGIFTRLTSPKLPKDNVLSYLTYSEYEGGVVDNLSISVINNSDQNVYFSGVEISTSRWDEGKGVEIPSCFECDSYNISSNISDYLATIRPNETSYVNLDAYSSNPAISISPNKGFPPFSGNVNIDVTGYFWTSTAIGFIKFPLTATILASRFDW